MVEAARLGAAERELGNVDCRVMDAQGLDLDDASIDGVLCRLGFMLMPDPAAAFRRTLSRRPFAQTLEGVIVDPEQPSRPLGSGPAVRRGPCTRRTPGRCLGALGPYGDF